MLILFSYTYHRLQNGAFGVSKTNETAHLVCDKAFDIVKGVCNILARHPFGIFTVYHVRTFVQSFYILAGMRTFFLSIFLRWPSWGFQLIYIISLLTSRGLCVVCFSRDLGLVTHTGKLKFFQLYRTAECLWVTKRLVGADERNHRWWPNRLWKSFNYLFQVSHRHRYRFFLLLLLVGVMSGLRLLCFVLWSCLVEFYMIPKDYCWFYLVCRRFRFYDASRGKGWENRNSLGHLCAKSLRFYVRRLVYLVFFWRYNIFSLKIAATLVWLSFIPLKSWLQLVSFNFWWYRWRGRFFWLLLLFWEQPRHTRLGLWLSEFWNYFKVSIRALLINKIIWNRQLLLSDSRFFRNEVTLLNLNRPTLLAIEVTWGGLGVYALRTVAIFCSFIMLFRREWQLLRTCLLWLCKPYWKNVIALL